MRRIIRLAEVLRGKRRKLCFNFFPTYAKRVYAIIGWLADQKL